MTAKNKVGIRVCGKEYTLMGVESEEYIQKIGLYIDKKMNEITRVNSKLSTSMAAVLTAINVADDYFKSHESEVGLKKELNRTNEELESLKEELKRLVEENGALTNKNTSIQLELIKREAELNEVKNTRNKATHPRVQAR